MPWSNVALVMNSRDAVSGTYNDAQFNAKNQNLVQGQIHSMSVNEVNFPYDIPNVQEGFNSFSLDYLDPTGAASVFLQPTVPPGFYTGAELAAAVTNAIEEAGAYNKDPNDVLNPIQAAYLPTCEYDAVTNRFKFVVPTAYAPAFPYMQFDSSWTFPKAEAPQNRVQEGSLGKDLLSIMGFVRNVTNQYNNGIQEPDPDLPAGALLPGSYPSMGLNDLENDIYDVDVVGGSAPLAFTQYIDVCSPQLCKFQEFPGGSTTNLARRGNLICRLYVSNNIAVTADGAVEGTRPFVINRQFQNARIMKWTTGNSVGQMDIQLYDDAGVPLVTTWAPRPYQITFNVYEGGDEKETVVGADGQMMSLPKYAPYRPENANAWSSPSFPMGRR
jgi:hypothetical protein